MANRFTFPRETALDSNGAPLSGARLHFYESGTTKPADVYADTALTVPATNPVVADSAGRFPDIFLQAIDYKVVLADSGGATVWTADPVSGTVDMRGNDFAPAQQSPADMTVLVGAGSLYDAVSRAIVARPAQSTPLIVAPVVNQRHDIVHLDRKTGAVGVATGTESPLPADPAVPAGALPVARVRLQTVTVEITAAEIDDIRELRLLGAGDAAARDIGAAEGQVPAMDAIGYPPANGSQISDVPLPRGYIDGLILANDAAEPANGIDIAPGAARDDSNAANLDLAATLVKRLDAAWAEGGGQGGLDTGAKAADSWYHVWLIRRMDTGTVDALFSTSATAPALPAGYTRKRRIGAVRTDGGGGIVAFTQSGNEFLWNVPVNDFQSSGIGTSAILQTLTVPSGINVNALFAVVVNDTSAGAINFCLITSTDQADIAPDSRHFSLAINVTSNVAGSVDLRKGVRTNTSSQIRYRMADGSVTVSGTTFGWIDERGKIG